jgi:hypothetical protein
MTLQGSVQIGVICAETVSGQVTAAGLMARQRPVHRARMALTLPVGM